MFNILLGSVTLSSFFTVLSIMLSENIINRIGIFNKYPRILNWIKFKTNLNKKISKFYLLMHLILILLTLLGNIVMFLS